MALPRPEKHGRPRAEREEPPPPARSSRLNLWICLALLAATFAVYAQVRHFDFVNFDDPEYAANNPHVRHGITPEGLQWAFTSGEDANWFPLTRLSHMLDGQLFGLRSGWHHLTSVLWHALAALLLFAFLHRSTHARWCSALVAFLFALHPLHVESVAWVSERKDVLGAFFWFLTLWAYVRYAERPRLGRYLLVLFCFCLGLMAKPMIVTLPFVLLLLDVWPLRRLAGARVLWEKLPLMALSAAAAVATYLVQRASGAVEALGAFPLGLRIENALVTYVVYMAKMLLPTRLAVFYPYPRDLLVWQPVLAALAIAGISALVLCWFRSHPYLAVGWFWYLGTLVPVIGLVQVGVQARADRYTYVPMVGVAIALVWGASEALEAWPRIRLALAAAVCAVCLVLTWFQVRYWRDSITLYRHAIDATSDNYVARYNLASVLEVRGKTAEAVAQLRETVRIRPDFASAHAELGQFLAKQGQSEEALRESQMAVRLRPDSAEAHFRLGSVLGTLGRIDDAAAEFSQTIRLQPENADAHYNLGVALGQRDKLQEAAREFSATLRLRPNHVNARFTLGIALARLGRVDEAIVQLSEALRLRPDFTEARQALEDAMSLKRRSGKQ